MGENKRKKFHDKDKYYKLAKEQGYRSRAAFKLTQINRKYHFLENAKIVIDLCAAPGGWTQVAARTMPKNNASTIIAVDILPIRSISSNVITLVGDITTEKCKAQIRTEIQGAKADVVLCDGAPNVGASYDRDAYQQNEIALHSLKCATEHLRKNGTYVTKMYRSADYNAYLWVAKQFFRSVQAVKPSASRMQSAEIFLVCSEYIAPTKIDPRILDPQHVFAQTDGAATGGGDAQQMQNDDMGVGKMTIFHKSFGKKQRSRQGYDMTKLDATMRNIGNVVDFIDPNSGKDPIAMLTVCTGLSFHDNQFYLNHKLTTPEIKACLADLKVLNKSDFMGLLKWRTKMQDAMKELNKGSDDEDEAISDDDGDGDRELNSDEEEENIQSEIEKLRQKKYREKKKVIKKERSLAAKRRRRAALGMDLNALEVPDNDKIFSLATITKKGDLEAVREVDLDKYTAEQLFPGVEDDEDGGDLKGTLATTNEDGEIEAQGEEDDIDEDTGYSYRLDRELDAAYDLYLAGTKNAAAKAGSKMQKRSKKAMRQKAMDQAQEDNEMMSNNTSGIDADTKAYAKLLRGNKDSDDSDSSEDEDADDESDDGFNAAPLTPKEFNSRKKEKEKMKQKKGTEEQQTAEEDHNPLIYKLPEDPTSVKTSRWFSNPLFESISNNASMATLPDNIKGKGASLSDDDGDDFDSMSEDAEDVQQLSSDDEKPAKKKSKKNKNNRSADGDEEGGDHLTAESVLASMPKTDKQIRHEKRKKAAEREQRKLARRAKAAGEPEGGFEIVDAESDDEEKKKFDGMSDQQKKKIKDAKALIKAGFGSMSTNKDSSGFEVVATSDSGPLPIVDKRKYDSENEDYDSDDYAQTLALGTMMLRRSKAKALVDASYNRFAWNDPEGLPDWFVDDENKSYRPQLPIPPELMAKMKEKFLMLTNKPIAKVAEARARKNKRARSKLAAAKKKAEAVANSTEISESMKLKAISKAMRGQDAKKPSKTYVVSKKGGGTRGGKGIKLVDKRMRNDKRSMERSTKKSKHGKKGGLTGSKRRRNHK